MGWGAKKAAAPQSKEDAVDVAIARQHLKEPLITGKELEERLEALDEAPEPNRLAEVEFMRLQANKGWTAERRYDVLRDFVRASGLYLELNKFVRKMR